MQTSCICGLSLGERHPVILSTDLVEEKASFKPWLSSIDISNFFLGSWPPSWSHWPGLWWGRDVTYVVEEKVRMCIWIWRLYSQGHVTLMGAVIDPFFSYSVSSFYSVLDSFKSQYKKKIWHISTDSNTQCSVIKCEMFPAWK